MFHWISDVLPERDKLVIGRTDRGELWLVEFVGGTTTPTFVHEGFIVHGIVAWAPIANKVKPASYDHRAYSDLMRTFGIVAWAAHDMFIKEEACLLKDPATVVSGILDRAKADIAKDAKRAMPKAADERTTQAPIEECMKAARDLIPVLIQHVRDQLAKVSDAA